MFSVIETPDPLGWGHFRPGGTISKNVVKDHKAMQHTAFQASKSSGSEVDNF